MQQTSIRYDRHIAPAFFAGATKDDVKWTINYLLGLLENGYKEECNRKDTMSVNKAKQILRQRKLNGHGVPADFNGMRDEVNPKYL